VRAHRRAPRAPRGWPAGRRARRGAGLGRQRHRRHAGQGLQPVGQLVHQRQRALDGGLTAAADGCRRSPAGAPSSRSGAGCASSCTSPADRSPGRWRGSSGSAAHSGAASRAPRGRAGRSAPCASGPEVGAAASPRPLGRSTPVLSQPPSSKISGSSCSRPSPRVQVRRRRWPRSAPGGSGGRRRAWLMRRAPLVRASAKRRCRRPWWSRWRRPAARRPARRCGIEPRERHAGQHALGGQGFDHPAADFGQAHRELVEEARRQHLDAGDAASASPAARGLGVVDLGQSRRPVLAQQVMWMVNARAQRPELVQMLEVALSRRICCSRVERVSTKPRRPSASTVSPQSRPGHLPHQRSRQANRPT
jgi:hypothetical protein